MSLVLWESQIRVQQAQRNDLVRGLHNQNYMVDNSAEILIVSPPKDFWKLLQNGSQLWLIDNIAIEVLPDRLRLKYGFNQTLVIFLGICCVLVALSAIYSTPSHDLAKVILALVILIPTVLLLNLAILSSSIKRDIRRAVSKQ